MISTTSSFSKVFKCISCDKTRKRNKRSFIEQFIKQK